MEGEQRAANTGAAEVSGLTLVKRKKIDTGQVESCSLKWHTNYDTGETRVEPKGYFGF